MSNASSAASTSGLRPQDRRALMVGVVTLAAMFGYARIIRPAIDELARRRSTLVEQRGLLARERSLLAIGPTLPQAANAVKHSLAGEQSRLFVGDSIAATAALTAFVTDVASATGVRLTMLDGRPPRSARAVTRLSADLRGEGSWRQVLAFTRALESSARLVDLPALRMERGPRGGPLGGDLVSLSATVTGYSRGVP